MTAVSAVIFGLYSTPTHADGAGSAPAVSPSDTEATLLDLSFKDGEIHTTKWQGVIQVGANPDGQMSAKLKAGHDVYLFGEEDDHTSYDGTKSIAGVFKFGVGGEVEVTAKKGDKDFDVTNLHVESPSVSFLAFEGKLYNYDKARAALKPGATEAEVRAALAKVGPTFTASFDLVKAKYVYDKSKELNTTHSVADISFLNFGLHKAWEINGVPFDVCAYGKPIGLTAGHSKVVGENSDDVAITTAWGGCLGIGLGPVGHLETTGEVSYSAVMQGGEFAGDNGDKKYIDLYDTSHLSTKVSVNLNNIAGTGIGAGAEYTY
ncbi:MAG TPA: hypothetical protein VL588_07110, partial [Bdellovibrionota bacterium]|nr:hypothetical protein [Bdellovibrionota bacterium]